LLVSGYLGERLWEACQVDVLTIMAIRHMLHVAYMQHFFSHQEYQQTTVDGSEIPNNPPGMYKTLQIMG